MKAKAFLLSNGQAMEEADRLGTPIPDAEFVVDDLLFDIRKVNSAFKNEDGDINLDLAGALFTIKWDERIWNELDKHFE